MFKISILLAAFFIALSVPAGHSVVNPQGSLDAGKHMHIVNVVAFNESNGVKKGRTCGGVLVDDYHVLTAAHCLIGYAQVDAIFGLDRGKSVSRIKASGWVIHEGYNDKTYANDIALLRLSSRVGVKPVLLPSRFDADLLDKKLNIYLYGWGSNGVRKGDGRLYYTKQVDVTNNLNVKYTGFSPSTMIAASYYNPKNKRYSGACKGDSGGPLLSNKSGLYLVGIVSYVAPNCNAKYPSVYTRVSAYLDWINDGKVFLASGIATEDITITGGIESVRVRIISNEPSFSVVCRNSELSNFITINTSDAEIGAPVGIYQCSIRVLSKYKTGVWSEEISVTVFPKSI